jgi:hypothetical protein
VAGVRPGQDAHGVGAVPRENRGHPGPGAMARDHRAGYRCRSMRVGSPPVKLTWSRLFGARY